MRSLLQFASDNKEDCDLTRNQYLYGGISPLLTKSAQFFIRKKPSHVTPHMCRVVSDVAIQQRTKIKGDLGFDKMGNNKVMPSSRPC